MLSTEYEHLVCFTPKILIFRFLVRLYNYLIFTNMMYFKIRITPYSQADSSNAHIFFTKQ